MTNPTECAFRKRAYGGSSSVDRRRYGCASHADAHRKVHDSTFTCTEKANRELVTRAHQAEAEDAGWELMRMSGGLTSGMELERWRYEGAGLAKETEGTGRAGSRLSNCSRRSARRTISYRTGQGVNEGGAGAWRGHSASGISGHYSESVAGREHEGKLTTGYRS